MSKVVEKEALLHQREIGISGIGVYIPDEREDNCDKLEKFGFEDSFLEEKIGVFKTARKNPLDGCSDLCVKAFESLQKNRVIDKNKIDVIIVVTQNPDQSIPHSGALVHGKLGLSTHCLSFDISLGCSGFVYGLSTIVALMKEHNLKNGVLFTSDPYSEVVDSEDRNTSLIFGDAATATLISDFPILSLGQFSFGTLGSEADKIQMKNERLFMNGRAVVRFAKKYIPRDIRETLEKNRLSLDQVDSLILHQGSKFMVDMISNDLGIPKEKVPFDIGDYGNTVSSSIPIILEKEMVDVEKKNFLLSGFGVGLSWASCVLKRI